MKRFGGPDGALRAALLVSCTLAACTPTREDALRKHEAAASALRIRLGQAADVIDKAKPPAENAKCAPTKPLGFSRFGDGHDTEVYVYEDLKRGGAPTEAKDRPKIDLLQDTPLHTLLADTHPQSKLGPAERKAKDEAAAKAYERATKVKTLVVLKQREHDRSRGYLALDYWVVNLDDLGVHCVGNVVARADPNLGARAYDVVGTDPSTGQKKVVASGETDHYWERMKFDADKKLEERFGEDLKIEYLKVKDASTTPK